MNSHKSIESPLIFYGAGGHARVAVEAARAAGLKPTMVVDDQPRVTDLAGLKVNPTAQLNWNDVGAFRFVVAIGDNVARARVFEDLVRRGGIPETVIHPFSWISPSAKIGAGTVVFGGVVVNANAVISENCILNTSCSVDHDGQIGPHAHLCPGVRLAGNVTIGARTMLGTQSSCIPGITIGSDALVGAGSVVVKNVPDNAKALGNPARVFHRA